MATKLAYKPANIKYKRYNVWLQMKSKIAADRVLKRFSRKIRIEDAPRDASPQFAQLSTPEAPISMPTLSLAWRPLCLCGKFPPQYCATSGFSGPGQPGEVLLSIFRIRARISAFRFSRSAETDRNSLSDLNT